MVCCRPVSHGFLVVLQSHVNCVRGLHFAQQLARKAQPSDPTSHGYAEEGTKSGVTGESVHSNLSVL